MFVVYSNHLSKCKTITPSLMCRLKLPVMTVGAYIVQSQCGARYQCICRMSLTFKMVRGVYRNPRSRVIPFSGTTHLCISSIQGKPNQWFSQYEHFSLRGVLVGILFCSHFNQLVSLYIYYDQCEILWRTNNNKTNPRLSLPRT